MEIKLPLFAKTAFGLITLIAVVYILYVLQDILIPLSFAGIIAMLLYPLCHRLEQWRFPRVLAIFVCLILTIAILVLLMWGIINQFSAFSEDLPTYSAKVTDLLNKAQAMIDKHLHVRKGKQSAELQKYGLEALKNSGKYVTDFLSGTTSILGNMAIIPIFVFFYLYYRDFFRSFFYKAFKSVKNSKIDAILSRIHEVVQNYLFGLLIVISIVAILNSAGLYILGIDYPVFFGILAALLLLIPYVGIAIGSLLPILIALLTKDSPMYAVGVLAIFMSVQMLESNFITPYIVGSKVSINSFAAMVVLILGGKLWGMAGLVLALPFIAIIKVIFDNVSVLKPYGFLLGDAEVNRKQNIIK